MQLAAHVHSPVVVGKPGPSGQDRAPSGSIIPTSMTAVVAYEPRAVKLLAACPVAVGTPDTNGAPPDLSLGARVSGRTNRKEEECRHADGDPPDRHRVERRPRGASGVSTHELPIAGDDEHGHQQWQQKNRVDHLRHDEQRDQGAPGSMTIAALTPVTTMKPR